MVAFSICALVFSVLSFAFSSYVFIRLVGRENSTHTIQYVPLDKELEKIKDEKKEVASDEHDDLEL